MRGFLAGIVVLGLLLAGPTDVLAVQSLADAARREAERRRELDRQGIAAKVIEGDPGSLAPDGAVSTSSPGPRFGSGEVRANAKSRDSPRSYRSALQKLDREIRTAEDRLTMLRERLQAERWALPKAGRASRSGGGAESRERMEQQIRELELRVKRLRQDRLATYDEGRRAGFQPGELDGKGRLP